MVYFRLADGGLYEAKLQDGVTLLETAQQNGIDGFLGECGGKSRCGTCHCYIDPTQAHLLPKPDHIESEMLNFVAAERKPGSRLACQIRLAPRMSGLRVDIPARQF